MTRPQSDCGDRFFYNCILIIFMHFLRVWLLPCRIIMHVSCQWCKSQMKCDMIVQTAHTEKNEKKILLPFALTMFLRSGDCTFPAAGQCLIPNSQVSEVVAETSSDQYPDMGRPIIRSDPTENIWSVKRWKIVAIKHSRSSKFLYWGRACQDA